MYICTSASSNWRRGVVLVRFGMNFPRCVITPSRCCIACFELGIDLSRMTLSLVGSSFALWSENTCPRKTSSQSSPSSPLSNGSKHLLSSWLWYVTGMLQCIWYILLLVGKVILLPPHASSHTDAQRYLLTLREHYLPQQKLDS